LSVVVFGSEPLLYQWFKDGMAITEATNSFLPLPNLQSNQVGHYSVTVTNLYGWAASSNALLTIPGVPFPFLWQGLVAYYPFSGNANDVAGTNNGTPVGATLTTDRFGMASAAYYFNGSSWIETPQYRLLDAASNATISAWVVIKSGTSGQVLSAGDYRGGYDPISLHFMPQVADAVLFNNCLLGNAPQARIGSRGAPYAVSGLVADIWHQVVIVLSMDNPLGSFTIYADGVANHSQIASNDGTTGFAGIAYDADMRFLIGALEGRPFYSTPDQFWSGKLDDIRIYNRAFSPNEVQQLYASEVQAGMRLEAQVTTNGVDLSFPTAANLAYSVLFRTNLTLGIWEKLADVPAQSTNSTAQVADPAVTNSPQRFYRLVTPPWPQRR
jgi:hypothetical protein